MEAKGKLLPTGGEYTTFLALPRTKTWSHHLREFFLAVSSSEGPFHLCIPPALITWASLALTSALGLFMRVSGLPARSYIPKG